MTDGPKHGDTLEKGTPPPATPPVAVAGMWYWLGPIGVLVIVAVLALIFWGRSEPTLMDPVAPTTGVTEGPTHGGQPGRVYDTPAEEREYRGDPSR